MPLTLSSTEQRQLIGAIDAMLSPLAYDTREAWFVGISVGIRPLFGGDSTLFTCSAGDSAETYSVEAPDLAAGFTAATVFLRGEVHFHEPEMEGVMTLVRRKRAMSVFTSDMLDRLTEGRLRRSLFYNEVARPLGAHTNYGLGLVGNDGEALLGVNAQRLRRDPLGEDTLAILRLIAPAFQSGFEIRARLSQSHRSLMQTIDALPEAMFVFETVTGCEIHRNIALTSLLARDPEAPLVEQRGLQVARALSVASHAGHGAAASRPADAHVKALEDLRTTTARYTMRASALPLGSFSNDRVVLVCVERCGIALPLPATLREHFGLTAREAEVALHLAIGESDSFIARTLCVSPHTVRHHVERVFQKLQVRSRKAIALRLTALH